MAERLPATESAADLAGDTAAIVVDVTREKVLAYGWTTTVLGRLRSVQVFQAAAAAHSAAGIRRGVGGGGCGRA